MALSLCAGIAANTGGIACDVNKAIPLFFAPWGGSLSGSDLATQAAVQLALETASELPNSNTGKLFPFPTIQEVTNNSEQNTTGTLGLGFTTIIREGRESYTFKVFAGIEQTKKLRKFNNTNLPVLMFDTNLRVWGKATGTNNATFVGRMARIFVSSSKFATGQNVEEGVVEITVAFVDIDNEAFVEIGSTGDITGLNDVVLTESSDNTVNVFHVQAIVPTGEMGSGINMRDTYGAALAMVGAWYAKVNGATRTISSVTATTPGWDVTLLNTPTLVTNDVVEIGWVAPQTLDTTYNVVGFEATPLITTYS